MSTRPSSHRRSSRQRYREFVRDYRLRRLDAKTEASQAQQPDAEAGSAEQATLASAWRSLRGGTRRAYLREYLRWLRPHRGALLVVSVLALAAAGLQMIEPLFMRFIVDRV